MEKNHYEELFDQMLRQMDISLIKLGEEVYSLKSENYILDDNNVICRTTQEVFDNLEAFIDDMFADDLDREAIDYGLLDFASHPWDFSLTVIEKYKNGTTQERKFVKDHEWEIEVLDMLCNHLEEVDIQNLESVEAGTKFGNEQVFYVRVTETYQKIVRVIATDPGEACEAAMTALNCGTIECSEYKDDSTDVELLDKRTTEDFYDTSELTLLDKDGEEL